MWTLIIDAVRQSTWVEQSILYLLIAFSVVSWGLILMKIKVLRRARRNNEEFLTAFNRRETLEELPGTAQIGRPMESVYRAAVATLRRDTRLAPEKLHEKVMLTMQHASKDEMAGLRWGAGFLASVGSSAPFIGLLGTVLGIMGTFHVLGKQKSATLTVVGPSISAALIATAAGLAVAIPSVMAYNWVLARVEALDEEMGKFIERMDFLTRTQGIGASGGVAEAGKTPIGVSGNGGTPVPAAVGANTGGPED